MLYPHLNGKRVILASQSPRRLELVRGLELEPVIWLKEVDESFPAEIKGPAIAEYVTRIKAQAYLAELSAHDVLITGDTVVLLGEKVLQKPQDRDEAFQMLSELSGKTHTVASGVAVTTSGTGIRSMVDTCDVTFRKLETDWIEHYIDQYEPYDKAGAYGVQDLIGFSGVEHMNGSYFTVMGLPTHKLFQLINSLKS
ncbi:MAG: Maf family protein [Bacteroidetes bacterium]|nr:Maf family protein [Bacteroidota bacterium]MDA1335605.1 Maf family protein [Bacteroidota bacterium]